MRTFHHNHQKAIKDIFDVYIDCDRKDSCRYDIDEPERLKGNNLQRLADRFLSLYLKGE